MQRLKDKEFWIHAILFIFIVGLLGGYVSLVAQVTKLKSDAMNQVSAQNSFPAGNCDAACQARIEANLTQKLNNQPSATPVPTSVVPTPTPVTIIQQVPAAGQKTTYIPLSGGFSTTSTDWVDVPGAQAYIDLKGNYSPTAYVTFEASVTASGGEAHARLFDATHSIAVDGSEVKSTSITSTLVVSGKLNLWSGNNLYKVQLKSLDSSNVSFDSGRIKLVY